jgi:hypothetical protein
VSQLKAASYAHWQLPMEVVTQIGRVSLIAGDSAVCVSTTHVGRLQRAVDTGSCYGRWSLGTDAACAAADM